MTNNLDQLDSLDAGGASQSGDHVAEQDQEFSSHGALAPAKPYFLVPAPMAADPVALLGPQWLARQPVSQRISAEREDASYLRFSTEGQRDVSLEIQLEICRSAAAKLGRTINDANVYSDKARTGATLIGRNGLEELRVAVRSGRIRSVIVSHLTRLARNLADLAAIYNECKAHACGIYVAERGTWVTTLEIAILGFMSEQERSDIMKRTSDGRRKMLKEGRYPSGRCYGYDRVPDSPGVLEINKVEAAYVRTIFEFRAEGRSPNWIARYLNRSKVPSALGTQWHDATIRSILQRPLYIGVLSTERFRHTKDFDTGKIERTPRELKDWPRATSKKLRIVNQPLWDRVQAAEAAAGPDFRATARAVRAHMLSGIAVCATCGWKVYAFGSNKVGRRLGCARAQVMEACSDTKTYYEPWAEKAVLQAVAEVLDQPEVSLGYAAALSREIERQQADASRERERLGVREQCLIAEIDASWVSGPRAGYSEESRARRVRGLESKLENVRQQLSNLPRTLVGRTVDGSKLSTLREAVADLITNAPVCMEDASQRVLADEIRALMKQVVLHRVEGANGLRAEVTFWLDQLVDMPRLPNDARATIVIEGTYDAGCRMAKRMKSTRDTASGAYAAWPKLDDRQWDAISGQSSADELKRLGVDFGCRELVDLMLFLATKPRPFSSIPSSWGARELVAEAMVWLVRSRRWYAIIDILVDLGEAPWSSIDGNNFRAAFKAHRWPWVGAGPNRYHRWLTASVPGPRRKRTAKPAVRAGSSARQRLAAVEAASEDCYPSTVSAEIPVDDRRRRSSDHPNRKEASHG